MSALITTIKLRAALCMRAAVCSAPGGEQGLLLALRDTTGLLPDGLTAQWMGDAAMAFLAAHLPELVPGRCLDLEIDHIRAAGQELRARVQSCALAPLAPSWVRHAAASPSTASTPSTQSTPSSTHQEQPAS